MAELASQAQIAELRRPKLLFTQAYLDDPITVNNDERFIPETKLASLDVISVVERDQADFASIDINESEPQNFPVHMMTRVFERTDFLRVIDKEFKQLV